MSLGKVVWLKVRLIDSVEAGNTDVCSAFSNVFQCESCYWDRFFPRICIIQKRIHQSPSCCWNVRARKSTGVQKKCRGGSLSVQIFFLKRNGIFNLPYLVDWFYSLTSDFDIILCFLTMINNYDEIMFKGVFVYRDQGRNICFLLAPTVHLYYNLSTLNHCSIRCSIHP